MEDKTTPETKQNITLKSDQVLGSSIWFLYHKEKLQLFCISIALN